MATLSEAFTAHPVRFHQPHLLDFSSLRELPDSHAWPKLRDHTCSAGGCGCDTDTHPCSAGGCGCDTDTHQDPIPVVDLHDPDVLSSLARACETWGVFQLIGHGVPDGILDRFESQCHRLFSLPAERKLRAMRQPDGISGYGLARISSFFSKLMWSEGFTIVGSPAEHARKLWPQDHEKFCEVVEEYNREMKQLAGRLMTLMLASLGFCADDVSWCRPAGPRGDGFREASSVLQLNSYPACPDPDRAMGLAAHTDSSLLTILYQNRTSGLQVRRPAGGCGGGGGGRWVTVPPVRGALVVNVGDLLQVMSNGRWPSVVHRAVVNRTQHRLSAAYIYGPPSHAEVAPMTGLLGPGGEGGPLYRGVTWPQYLGIKAKHFDKALAAIKVVASATAGEEEEDHNLNNKY